MGAPVFFRADDAGLETARLALLLAVFEARGLPVDVAVIPSRVGGLAGAITFDERSHRLHVHGLEHQNRAPEGERKCELVAGLDRDRLLRDLRRARRRVRAAGPFSLVFTPPWNRMAEETLPVVAEAGYEILSRNRRPRAEIGGLLELAVNVDLHTGPERLDAANGLLEACAEAAERYGHVGVMLHHTFMAEADFGRLEQQLRRIVEAGYEPCFLESLR